MDPVRSDCPVDVTVAIPTRNAGPQFARTLDMVFRQRTSRNVEVMAIDSGSTDGTLDLLARYPLRLERIPQNAFDWGRLREQLFEWSRGRIVVSLSQDAIPAREDWLDKLVRPLGDPAIGASSGSSVPDPERHFPQFQWERNGYYYFTREIGKFTRRYGRGMSFANTAVPRAVWERLHVDPQATGEDFQFQIKLHAAGLGIAFPTDAPVLHHHNYKLRAVFRRCRNEGLALRQMGCPYHELDLLCDLASPAKYRQWLREALRGTLTSGAEWVYPAMRPVAVYMGSRFARRYVWY